MLMDLFFDTLEGLDPDIKCHRVHYYDFMQDVHRRMHEAKKQAPPRDVSRHVVSSSDMSSSLVISLALETNFCMIIII